MTPPIAEPLAITGGEFGYISELLHRHTGIRLTPGKEAMVANRLDRRLRQLGMGSYSEYIRLLERPDQEAEVGYVVDRLTTNETFFFREAPHFGFLRDTVVPSHRGHRPLRLWSAASSTGEEAYTAAMVLADAAPATPWEIVGTDVSSRVVAVARRGVYPIAAAERIPRPLLRKYCRKGRDDYAGLMAIAPELRAKVTFLHANLMTDLRSLGRFDVILLRNVMIYFEAPTKHELVARVQEMLHPGGHLIVGHSESLSGITSRLRMVTPSVYRLDGDGRG
ncbi:protein-glutamate O-methyltransferase [Planomonospora alba]|uniref:protein-glutamate O-methyltransferase n=1 Tax=Planomonospora alba TaxID=161354 RepID=A0ABP6NJ95_9ACTN